MRKTNVFGKKLNQFKPLYFIAVIFVVVLAGFFGVNYYQNQRLDTLKTQENQLQAQINQIVNRQIVNYHDVDQILPNLPTTYDQLRLINELEFIRAVSGLSTAQNYTTSFNENLTFSFPTGSLPATVKAIGITVTMLVPTIDHIYAYLDQVIAQDRLFYINTASIMLPATGSLSFTVNLVTFYNPVNV